MVFSRSSNSPVDDGRRVRVFPAPLLWLRSPVRRRIPCDRTAFSLVELLAVMAVVALLAASSSHLVRHMGQSGAVTKAGRDLSGVFEAAKAYAMAHNTKVWVVLQQHGDDLTVSVGAEPSDGGEADLVALQKPQTYRNIRVVDLGEMGNRPSSPVATRVDLVDGEEVRFRYNRRGELAGEQMPAARVIEIGLQYRIGEMSPEPDNYAAIHMPRLGGSIQIHRP